jgi:hypothetical protein
MREAGHHALHFAAAKELVAHYPGEVTAQLEAAFGHDRNGLETDAIRHYEEARRLGGIPTELRRRFFVGFGATLRNVGRPDDAVAVLGEALADDPGYPAYAAFLSLALLAAGHPRAAVAAMLGCALDAAAPGAFDGFERALGHYHAELLTSIPTGT